MDDKEVALLTTRSGVKGNVRAITISDFEVEDHLDKILDIVEAHYDFYAWIIHDKDIDTPPHLHLLAVMRGGTTLKTHCEFFQDVLPANFVCKVKNARSMAKYLIHKGHPKKFQYSVEEVFTNDKGRYMSMLDTYVNSGSVFKDYANVLSGSMSFDNFIHKYEAEFSSMPFYQKLSIYHRILSGALQVGPLPSYTDSSKVKRR